MNTFSKILVPLDGSPQAEAILPLVCSLADSEGARVVLLRITDPEGAEYAAAPALLGLLSPELESEVLQDAQSLRDRALDEARLHAEGYLRRVMSQHFSPGAPVEIEVSGGPAADAILDFAAGIHADLIALSLSGRDDEHRRLSSRVCDELLHRADVPVLSMRSGR
jgi:nucleotide-binding universal stress UspA family protein